MNLMMFILGLFIGMFFVGVIMAGARRNELTEAYKKGRADERSHLIEQLETCFGVDDQGTATDGGKDNG